VALPLSFEQLQRETAFLLVIALTVRTVVASMFVVVHDHRRGEGSIPSRLSKTDRQRHLSAPVTISRLPASSDASVCPVVVLEAYLCRQAELHVAHDFVFCGFRAPREPISMTVFSDRLRWVLRQSGIAAPPGSTRSTSVSDAFARGEDLATVLRAGDWSRARTFFRHYLRMSVSTILQ